MLSHTLKITIALAALAGYAKGTTYANFCDDTSCSVNCGESVSVDNPGCLNESGRNSIAFHDINAPSASLVISPSPNCPCQSQCISGIVDDLGSGPDCFSLEGQEPGQSYRFIGGSVCDANNC